MGFTNAEQLRELFLAGGMGFLLGAYYDVFRILRRWLRPSAVSVFFQDCLYFASAAVFTFLFTLAMTDGELRVYVLIGLLLGFVAYRYTVGLALVGACDWLIRWSGRLHRCLRRWMAIPFRWLSGCFRPLGVRLKKGYDVFAKKTKEIFKKGLQPLRKILYNHNV